MTSPAQTEALVVELAQLGGVDIKSERTLVTLIGGLATIIPGVAGQWLHVPTNQRLVALAGFALIVAAHLLGKSLHHVAIERANGGVKQAMIHAAMAANAPLLAESPADISGAVIPPESPPQVTTSVDTVPNDAVGAGLPVVSAVAPDASTAPLEAIPSTVAVPSPVS